LKNASRFYRMNDAVCQRIIWIVSQGYDCHDILVLK